VQKFNRIYDLLVETNHYDSDLSTILIDNVKISEPFTVEFVISRNTCGASNTATFTIYNLGEPTRRKIYKDQYDVKHQRAIQFSAGYGSREGQNFLSQVFNGEIKRAYSYRSGPDVKTEIECFSGAFGMVNGFASMTLPQGTPLQVVMQALANTIPGTKPPATIGNFLETISGRGTSLFGNPAEMLKELSNNNFFIDEQKVYCLNKDEVVPGVITQINTDSGIVQTPKRSDTMVEVTLIFEPRIRVAQMILLDSNTERNYNGVYKVVGVTHRGTISATVGGDCLTTLQLMGGNIFKLVQ
jgi:hypothetical protein